MGQQQPNQLARTLAIGALVVGFFLFVITIATSGGGDSGGDDDGSDSAQVSDSSGPTAKGERAIAAGVWVVGEGDTLVSISEATGIDIDELVELNPDIDPQVLNTGQRISLRAGGADEEPDAGDSVDAGDTPGPSGSGVGDEGPTGTPETTTDEFGDSQ